MATAAEKPARQPYRRATTPDRTERVLGIAALLLLAAVTAALVRGIPTFDRVPWVVWPHLVTVLVALALTPVILLRRRGDDTHRLLGRIWAGAMILTALTSFLLREPGGWMGFSVIHLLSVWTLIQVPLIWWAARTGNLARHRGAVRGMVIGALLIAGFFTFAFDRLMARWLFG